MLLSVLWSFVFIVYGCILLCFGPVKSTKPALILSWFDIKLKQQQQQITCAGNIIRSNKRSNSILIMHECHVVCSGGLMGKRRAASGVQTLVALRLVSQTAGWQSASACGDSGGETFRHRGARWPGDRLLHPGLGTMSSTTQQQVWDQHVLLCSTHFWAVLLSSA